MSISELGSLGEFVGAFAVLATLIYLALQIRQNTAATRAQIHQARSDQAQDFFLFAADSPYIAEIAIKLSVNGAPDPSKLDELNEVERWRLTYWSIANQARFENMFYQYKHGFLAEETYFRTLMPVSRVIPLWDALGITQFKDGEFSAELERIRKEGP